MNAIILSRILSGGLVLLIVIIGVGFYFASQFLTATATETDRVRTDIAITESNISKLQRLQNEMKNKSEIVDRAKQIISESGQYQYQDQIVRDVNAYARLAGVEIGGFTFISEATTGSLPGAAVNPALPGIKKTDANVTLRTPIQYDNFLRFLVAIEQNLTKMQITGVNMVPDSKNPNLISNPTIGLQIYIKG